MSDTATGLAKLLEELRAEARRDTEELRFATQLVVEAATRGPQMALDDLKPAVTARATELGRPLTDEVMRRALWAALASGRIELSGNYRLRAAPSQHQLD